MGFQYTKSQIKKKDKSFQLFSVQEIPSFILFHLKSLPDRVSQSVTCLATDVILTADPGVRKYVHEVLVNCLFKLAYEKVWLGELTVPP